MYPDASCDAVVAYVLHAIGGHTADLLQLLEAEEYADLRESSLLGGVAHGNHESLRSVHEYVVVHLAVSRLEDVQDVLAVGGVDDPPQGEEGEGLRNPPLHVIVVVVVGGGGWVEDGSKRRGPRAAPRRRSAG